VDFQDVRTVMLNAGAAVMGSAVTEGESRARRAAEEAISSPLLDNKDIDGAKKILLSIVSGDTAELQMDELSEITDYIQEMAGDEAEVIFGHGVDAELGNCIRVTVIATGFDEHVPKEEENQETKYFDLETTQQISIFEKSAEPTVEPETPSFNDLEIETVENKPLTPNRMYEFDMEEKQQQDVPSDEVEEGLFGELKEDFEVVDSTESDESISDDGMMELKMKRQKLEEEAQHRVRKLSGLNSESFDSGDFKEKLDVPAYLRRKVNLEQTPHSSERNISRFNLTDDNQILGNNKFLHDNVD
jgi:cell division protein FtsZ